MFLHRGKVDPSPFPAPEHFPLSLTTGAEIKISDTAGEGASVRIREGSTPLLPHAIASLRKSQDISLEERREAK